MTAIDRRLGGGRPGTADAACASGAARIRRSGAGGAVELRAH
jgi:hypothetical protein